MFVVCCLYLCPPVNRAKLVYLIIHVEVIY